MLASSVCRFTRHVVAVQPIKRMAAVDSDDDLAWLACEVDVPDVVIGSGSHDEPESKKARISEPEPTSSNHDDGVRNSLTWAAVMRGLRKVQARRSAGQAYYCLQSLQRHGYRALCVAGCSSEPV